MGRIAVALRRLRSWAWAIPGVLIVAVAAAGQLWGKVVALAVLSGVVALGIGIGIGLWASRAPDPLSATPGEPEGAPAADSQRLPSEGADGEASAVSSGGHSEPVQQSVDSVESQIVEPERESEPEAEAGPGGEPAAASMRGAKLGGARLRGADLRGVDLRGADLTDADLRGANLEGARLGSAES